MLYSQRANCFVFDSNPGSPHTTTPAGNGMFMVYTIDRVQTREQPLVLRRAKFYAGGEKAQNPMATSFTHHMTFQDQTIPAHTVKNDLGWIVVKVEGPNPAAMKTSRRSSTRAHRRSCPDLTTRREVRSRAPLRVASRELRPRPRRCRG